MFGLRSTVLTSVLVLGLILGVPSARAQSLMLLDVKRTTPLGVTIGRPGDGFGVPGWRIVQTDMQRVTVGARWVNYAIERRRSEAAPSTEEWYLVGSIVSSDGGLTLTRATLGDGVRSSLTTQPPQILDCRLVAGKPGCRHRQDFNVRLTDTDVSAALQGGVRVVLTSSVGDQLPIVPRPVLFQAIQSFGDSLR